MDPWHGYSIGVRARLELWESVMAIGKKLDHHDANMCPKKIVRTTKHTYLPKVL